MENINLCVSDEVNQNLTLAQKQLLQWHFKLGHTSFATLQALTRKGQLPSIISRCAPPLCASCRFGAASRTPTGKSSHHQVPEVQGGHGHIKANDLQPGQRVSVDNYDSRVRGRLRTSAGKTSPDQMYCGGTIFVDHATGLIHVEHQSSLSAAETLRSKNFFERMAYSHGTQILNYHADNEIFTSQEFSQHLQQEDQPLTLSGVRAHHQNAVAERALKTVVYRARIMLLHASLRWPESADASLWPMAFLHATYLWNLTPNPFSHNCTDLCILAKNAQICARFGVAVSSVILELRGRY